MWPTTTRLVDGLVSALCPRCGSASSWAEISDTPSLRPVLAALVLIRVIAAVFVLIIMFGVRELGKVAAVSAAVFYPHLYTARPSVFGIFGPCSMQEVLRLVVAARPDWPYGAGPWIFVGLKLRVVIRMATLSGARDVLLQQRARIRDVNGSPRSGLDFDRLYVVMVAAALVVYALWLCLAAFEFALSRSGSDRSSTGESLPGGATEEG